MIKSPLSSLISNYDYLFCDVWGVVHNGVSIYPDAEVALINARKAGHHVTLLTNSPRRNTGVVSQLAELGLSNAAYDEIVTSGDVTRHLIEQHSKEIFHLGPERDLSLFDGLGVNLVDELSAKTVVCTGLFDDKNEGLEPYHDMIAGFKDRDVTFICANPDLVVHHGGKLLYCAGSLAKMLEDNGGTPLVAGKPHNPIYSHAHENINRLAGQEIDKSKILGIGDALPTDVKGACDYGLDVLFISGGIHCDVFGELDSPDPQKIEEFLHSNHYDAKGYLPKLSW